MGNQGSRGTRATLHAMHLGYKLIFETAFARNARKDANLRARGGHERRRRWVAVVKRGIAFARGKATRDMKEGARKIA